MNLKNLNESDIIKALGRLDKKSPADGFESIIMRRITNNDYVPGIFEAFFKAAKVSFIAAACLFCVFATFNYLTPDIRQNKYDNIEALNNYVYSDNCLEKKMVDTILG